MKTKQALILVLLALCTLHSALSTAKAQGTAFTYQGRLNTNGVPANGLYDFEFALSNAPSGGSQIGSTITQTALGVTNGLFTTTLDFGAVFTGNDTWLAISVRSNNVGSYTPMTPLQELNPAPYAIFANTASNLSGTLPAAHVSGTLLNAQLANNSVTVTAGTGLSGGGSVALGNSITLNNAGVLAVASDPDILATTIGGVVTLGSTATNLDTAGAIVKRDGAGNFLAGTITANLAGTATLANNVVSGINITNAFLTNAVITNSAFGGNGGGLTNLNASQLISIGNGNVVFPAGISIGNFFVGPAGNTTTFGSNNTAIGDGALTLDTTGSYNTAYGFLALSNNAYGGDNTGIGYGALYRNSGGFDSTATGYLALADSTTGTENTAYGSMALLNNTDGSDNTGEGYLALNNNTTGSFNTAYGVNALAKIVRGTNNIGLGNQAGINLLENESSNIDIGNPGVLGDNNIIRIGTNQTTTYIAGVINGDGGGLTNINASISTSVGNTLGGVNNFFIGTTPNSTTGSDNTAIGYNALENNGSGTDNTSTGQNALNNNTSGSGNTATGQGSLYENQSGWANTATGNGALFNIYSGYNNTADGFQALFYLGGDSHHGGTNNIALGYEAGYNFTGNESSNIDIGNVGSSAKTTSSASAHRKRRLIWRARSMAITCS